MNRFERVFYHWPEHNRFYEVINENGRKLIKPMLTLVGSHDDTPENKRKLKKEHPHAEWKNKSQTPRQVVDQINGFAD